MNSLIGLLLDLGNPKGVHPMDNTTLGMIKRICDIILNHPTVTEELDSLALRVAYQQDIFNANTEIILPIRYYVGNVKPLNEVKLE